MQGLVPHVYGARPVCARGGCAAQGPAPCVSDLGPVRGGDVHLPAGSAVPISSVRAPGHVPGRPCRRTGVENGHDSGAGGPCLAVHGVDAAARVVVRGRHPGPQRFAWTNPMDSVPGGCSVRGCNCSPGHAGKGRGSVPGPHWACSSLRNGRGLCGRWDCRVDRGCLRRGLGLE